MLHNIAVKVAPFGRWDAAKARRPLARSLGIRKVATRLIDFLRKLNMLGEINSMNQSLIHKTNNRVHPIPTCLPPIKSPIRKSLVMLAVTFLLPACDEKRIPEDHVFTLYSTNSPNDTGRSGVATYDLAKEPFNSAMCQEAADLYQADFEKRKKENGWSSNTKMRYWCEKGRFKK